MPLNRRIVLTDEELLLQVPAVEGDYYGGDHKQALQAVIAKTLGNPLADTVTFSWAAFIAATNLKLDPRGVKCIGCQQIPDLDVDMERKTIRCLHCGRTKSFAAFEEEHRAPRTSPTTRYPVVAGPNRPKLTSNLSEMGESFSEWVKKRTDW